MNRRILAGLVPALLGASLAFGQDQPRPQDPQKPMNRPQGDRVVVGGGMQGMNKPATGQVDVLVKGKNIVGAKVVNRQNEKLGSIDDVLVEARSGYAVYGILEHGGVLGIGDKKVAIPWNALEVLPTSDGDATVVLDSTVDQLKQAPTFDKDQWALLGERSWMKKTHEYFKTEPSWRSARTGGWGRESAITAGWTEGKDLEVNGTITKVERKRLGRGMSEGVILTVKTDDGQERQVQVGPDWFVSGQSVTFKEGQQVRIRSREVRYQDGTVIVAREVATPEGGRLVLREENGTPVWDTTAAGDTRAATRTTTTTTTTTTTPANTGEAFVRFSEMKGKNVESPDGKKLADVRELAVNPATGRVPFIILGVGGLVGVGERDIAVPWQACQFIKNGDKLSINADETTLKNAPALDKAGFAMLNDPGFRRQVHSYFGKSRTFATPEPGFDSGPGTVMHEGDAQREAWSTGSPYNKLYGTETKTFTGTVQDVSTASPMQGMSDAVVITIKGDDGAVHVVQVGPTWFVNRQDLRFVKGDQVTVKGSQSHVGNDDVVMASEVQSSQGTLRLRDDQGRPRWDANRPGDSGRGGMGTEDGNRGDKSRDDKQNPRR